MSMKTSNYCLGCYNDRYNHPGTCERPGVDAPVTSKNCWSLASAELVTRYEISTSCPMNIRSAYRKVKVPSCYRKSGYAYCKELPPKETARKGAA
jgi:hypothetical protein